MKYLEEELVPQIVGKGYGLALKSSTLVLLLLILTSCSQQGSMHSSVTKDYKQEVDSCNLLYNKDLFYLAIEKASKILIVDSECVECYLFRGMSYDKINNYDKAIRDYSTVIDKSAKWKIKYSKLSQQNFMASAYNQRSNLFLVTGKNKEAIEDLFKFWDIDTMRAYHFTKLGLAYYRLGNNINALKYFKMGYSLDTSSYIATLNLGQYYLNNNEFELAKPCFDKAVILHPNAESYLGKGLTNYSLKNYFTAEEDIKKSVSYYDKDEFAYYMLAKCNLAKRDTTEFCRNIQISTNLGMKINDDMKKICINR